MGREVDGCSASTRKNALSPMRRVDGPGLSCEGGAAPEDKCGTIGLLGHLHLYCARTMAGSEGLVRFFHFGGQNQEGDPGPVRDCFVPAVLTSHNHIYLEDLRGFLSPFDCWHDMQGRRVHLKGPEVRQVASV